MKVKYVADIETGEQINDIFVLLEKQIGYKKDGSLFVNMTLADKTGQIKAVMWENIEYLVKNIPVGNFVRILANAGKYRDMIQLVLKDIKLVSNDNKVNSNDFLPVTKRDINKMFNRIKEISLSIKDLYLKELFELFWDDISFVKKFKKAPASKHLHHAYIGGLLEHTLSMLLVGEKIAVHYCGINRDMLLSGIILHDIGKIEELSYGRSIDYTDEGRLLSHIVIGVEIVENKIKQISNFPYEKKILLKHLIVSHHGSKEFGSPEVPKTLESILLNCIDDMDFRVNSIREYIDSDITDNFWTNYNKVMGRHFYKYNGE